MITRILYTTETGSTYEIDLVKKRARRQSGLRPATPRSADWRAYEAYTFVAGNRLLIQWTDSTPLLEGSPTEAHPATLTSPVIDVVEEDDYRVG